MAVLWDCIVPARLSSASLPGVPTITSGLFAFIASACSQYSSHYMQESQSCVQHELRCMLSCMGWESEISIAVCCAGSGLSSHDTGLSPGYGCNNAWVQEYPWQHMQ